MASRPVQLPLPAPPADIPIPNDFSTPHDSQPEILIQMEVDDPSSDDLPTLRRQLDEDRGRRRPHDSETGWDMTRIDLNPIALSDGVPGAATGPVTMRNPGEPGQVRNLTETGPVSSSPTTGPLAQRTSKVGAAALPPARPIARPASRPAMTSSPVARPTSSEERRPSASDSMEVYTPPPPSTDPASQPPERPGQYSQHKKISTRIPPGDTMPEQLRPASPPQGRAGSAPTVTQSGRPAAPGQAIPQAQPATRSSPVAIPTPMRQGSSQAIPLPQPATRSSPVAIPTPARPSTQSTTGSQPRAATPPPVPAAQAPSRSTPPPVPPSRLTPIPVPAVRPQGEPRPRTPTPQRVSMTPPTGTPHVPSAPAGRGSTPNAGGGVVMSRPAVIVGAPAKPAGAGPRVRKAREDEGRGFGQGLISEKSLDEVILAYLSEDGEDK